MGRERGPEREDRHDRESEQRGRGDKRRLLLGVVESAGETSLRTPRELVNLHLSEAPAAGADLARVIGTFAAELGSSLVASTDYAAAVRLIAENEALLPELEDHPLDRAHAEVLAECFANWADAGVLDVADPRLAAEHFSALTTLRVLNEPPRHRSNPRRVREIMTDGADVFLRAYSSRAV